MPEISITDNLGTPIDGVQLDLTQPSSLIDYAKAQVLHLLVAPDFVVSQGKPLPEAAAKPVHFEAKLGNDFALGTTQPAITISPKVDAVLRANAKAGDDLFDDDEFHVRAEIEPGAAYVGLAFTGTLGADASATAGDLTFGLKASGSVTLEFLKAFPAGDGAPALGAAVGQMISGYIIPASVKDLALLQAGDVCTVAGQGSLTVSGSFDVTAPVNPLASVNLPLGAGTLDVKDGLIAGVSAGFTLSGGYQIRVRRLGSGTIELSYLRARGTKLDVGVHASASASVSFGGTDLLAGLLGAICKSTTAPELLKGLTPEEVETFNAAVKQGVQHSVEASIDAALSASDEHQTAFQYAIDLAALDEASTAAVNRALRGDLSVMTGAGIAEIDSVVSRARRIGTTLKVNLLGIVNMIALSKLMDNCEVLFEPASGDLTIKETAQSERISAISNLANRQETLRKALFESVLVTTTYRAGKAISPPELDCECLHFAMHASTTRGNVSDYLNWFAALRLIQAGESAELLGQFGGDGSSACVMRASFSDAECEQLFLESGKAREESYYLEFGRQAMRQMLAPSGEVVDRARYQVLDKAWKDAVEIGPSPELRSVIPLNRQDPHFELALDLVRGDVYDIAWWATSMHRAGVALLAVREYLAGRDAAGLQQDAKFQQLRDGLQKTMLKVVANSKARFDLPWGMAALYWAAGSTGKVSGRLSAGTWTVTRP